MMNNQVVKKKKKGIINYCVSVCGRWKRWVYTRRGPEQKSAALQVETHTEACIFMEGKKRKSKSKQKQG